MSAHLSEAQNTILGVTAAFLEGVILQPTLYWKNARAMKLPFTINPKIIYRGTAASIFNEMQMMGLQFGFTGFFRKLFNASDGAISPSAQIYISSGFGGMFAALAASPVELIMIQQQRFGGSFISTPTRIIKTYGVTGKGIMRGATATMMRDCIYVTGLLGITPTGMSLYCACSEV